MTSEKQEIYFGRCKCCLKETYLRNMWFTGKNEDEIFGQMLVDCFAIDWLVQGNIEDDKICEACISKLRVAVDFKRQVMESQAETVLSKKEQYVKSDVQNGESSTNQETEEKEEEEETLQHEKKTYEEVEFLEEEILEEESNDDDNQDWEPVEKKRKWPKHLSPSERYKHYRQYTDEDLEAAVEAVKSKKMTRAKAAETYNVPPKTISKKVYGDDTERKDRFKLKGFAKAIRAILTHTNATPFRIKKTRYCCFFCPCDSPEFESADALRDHTHSEHVDKVIQIEYAVRPYHLNQMIRIDILNLACECGTALEWPDLLDHLQLKHNVTDIQEAWKKIVPYVLTNNPRKDSTCVFCDFSACFSKLDTHMNKHYQNYICDECGKPFVTHQRLKSHELYHDYGEFRCDICNRVFVTVKSKRNHIKGVHERSLSFKCTLCPKLFSSYLSKYRHIKTDHHDLLETNGMKCELCNKAFWPRDYRRHMRQVHFQYQCGDCDKKFENQDSLDNHRCTVETVRYQCDLCFVVFYTVKEVIAHKERCEQVMKQRKQDSKEK